MYTNTAYENCGPYPISLLHCLFGAAGSLPDWSYWVGTPKGLMDAWLPPRDNWTLWTSPFASLLITTHKKSKQCSLFIGFRMSMKMCQLWLIRFTKTKRLELSGYDKNLMKHNHSVNATASCVEIMTGVKLSNKKLVSREAVSVTCLVVWPWWAAWLSSSLQYCCYPCAELGFWSDAPGSPSRYHTHSLTCCLCPSWASVPSQRGWSCWRPPLQESGDQVRSFISDAGG